jgi:hypothetical protein
MALHWEHRQTSGTGLASGETKAQQAAPIICAAFVFLL